MKKVETLKTETFCTNCGKSLGVRTTVAHGTGAYDSDETTGQPENRLILSSSINLVVFSPRRPRGKDLCLQGGAYCDAACVFEQLRKVVREAE